MQHVSLYFFLLPVHLTDVSNLISSIYMFIYLSLVLPIGSDWCAISRSLTAYFIQLFSLGKIEARRDAK